VKFLVDAQLPTRLVKLLQQAEVDTIHTRDLPRQNATADVEINAISMQQERIVITKDSDFLDSFLISGQPYKLLLVTTGNITNTELLELFTKNLSQLLNLFEQHSLIEINRDNIIVHQ
jgi:predicted nuclease of predicted toxin-antitoxin system